MGPLEHAPATDPAQIVAPGQGGHLHAEGGILNHPRRRHLGDDGLEQGVHASAGIFVGIAHDPALQGGTVDHGEVCLLVGGTQLEEQVEGLVQGAMRVGVRSIDFVDHDDRPQTEAQGPHENVPGLRHGAFIGVYQQEDRVDHG